MGQLTFIRNPKQAGSIVYDCIPQVGPCPNACNECFYNRPGAFYTDIVTPSVPNPADLPDGAIVRMNSGHDSNLHRNLVLSVAKLYPQHFFNTSIPRLDFPGPVVLTVNPKEDSDWHRPPTGGIRIPANLMFVRIRVSPANRQLTHDAVRAWTARQVPVVLTFMRYYDMAVPTNGWNGIDPAYVFKKHILNSYWCPTPEYTRAVMAEFADNRLVMLCGGHEGGLCRGCRNCETHYLQAAKRLRGE